VPPSLAMDAKAYVGGFIDSVRAQTVVVMAGVSSLFSTEGASEQQLYD